MNLLKVLKYNPYHGKDGRFTTEGSAVTISAAGKKMRRLSPQQQGKRKKRLEREAEILREREKAIARVEANAARAQRRADARAAFRSTVFRGKNYTRPDKRYPLDA